MQPIMKPYHAPTYHGLPRATGTSLFLHRIKQSIKPTAPPQAMDYSGHPLKKLPVLVKPAKAIVRSKF